MTYVAVPALKPATVHGALRLSTGGVNIFKTTTVSFRTTVKLTDPMESQKDVVMIFLPYYTDVIHNFTCMILLSFCKTI